MSYLAKCRAECRPLPADTDAITWTLARAIEIDGGSDASIWQAISEHHSAECITRALNANLSASTA